MVRAASSAELDTVVEANAATIVTDWTANLVTTTATVLTPSTTYWFQVIVRDEAGNMAIYTAATATTPADTTAPAVGGGGTITPSGETVTTVDLAWTVATDNYSAQANLEYKVVRAAASADIDTVAEANAATIVTDWSAGLTSTAATGLLPSTTYWFQVIVRDEAGNMAIYTTISTAAQADATAPTVGGGGTITPSNQSVTTVNLTWTAATDDASAQADLEYKVVRAVISASIDTVAEANAATIVTDWTADLTSTAATGLTPATIYWFQVIVRDEAGNMAIYTAAGTSTLADTTAPTVIGGGTITPSNQSVTTVDLAWTAADDNAGSQANLEYKVVRAATSASIDTVAEANAATIVTNWTADLTSTTATGLLPSTTYWFQVIVRDDAGNMAVYTPAGIATPADTTAPSFIGGSTITPSNETVTTLDLAWIAATDDASSQANLEYKVVRSATSASIDTVAEANAATTVTDWTAGLTNTTATGLLPSTTYWFQVIVRDEAGNTAIYTAAGTATPQDTTAPTPGNVGAITSENVASTSLTLNWIAASDDATDAANLTYQVYQSANNNIATVTDCVDNGAPVGANTADIATMNVTGLSAGTTYYFNVLVQDEAGNKAVYTMFSQTTKTVVPTDYIIRWHLDNNGTDEKGVSDLSASTGSPSYSTSSPKEGTHYLVLDGSSDIYGGANYTPSVNAITISAWLYVDASLGTNTGTVIDLGTALGIYYDGTADQFFGGPSSINSAQTTSTPGKGAWHHVVLTWDGTDIRIYLNGSSTPEATVNALGDNITSLTADPWALGSASASNFWYGNIDDVIIYDRAVSGAEVTQIYNAY